LQTYRSLIKTESRVETVYIIASNNCIFFFLVSKYTATEWLVFLYMAETDLTSFLCTPY
jgi:hypothetical protein